MEERLREQVANSLLGSVIAKWLKSTSNVKDNVCYKSSLKQNKFVHESQTNGAAKEQL